MGKYKLTTIKDIGIENAIRKHSGKSVDTTSTSKLKSSHIFRYPQDHEWNRAPYIRFSCWRPEYNNGQTNKGVGSIPFANICLYMPMGVQQGDSANWEQVGSGIVGSLMEEGQSLAGMWERTKAMAGNVKDYALGTGNPMNSQPNLDAAAVALGRTYGDELVGLAAGLTGGVVGGAATYVIARQAMNEYAKQTQVSLNPREFMLYRSPNMRQFSYDFRFIPSSEKEAMEALDIIKYFRASMYPEMASEILPNSTYSFPDVWATKFENTTGIPSVPPCALTNVNVTYNPNSMSFYANSGVPVEIMLNLTFAELAPINRKLVEEEGF